jgi:hypothetical protein
LQYPLSQHAGYVFTSFDSIVQLIRLQNRLMKADTANLLFVKRKVCA